jgi:hypothetical protein
VGATLLLAGCIYDRAAPLMACCMTVNHTAIHTGLVDLCCL